MGLILKPREAVYGSTDPDAVYVGRLVDAQRGIAEKMYYGGERHVLLFGPNGKGKGTGILIPNLLQMSGSSIFVIDLKGELAAVTAAYRRTLGKVVIINPFGLHVDIPGYNDLKSRGFNPLVRLDPDLPSFNVEAALMAEAMVPVEGKEPHFSLSARALVAAIIMYVVIEARNAGQVPTIARVRKLLCKASDAPHAGNDFEGAGIPKLAQEMMRSAIAGLRNKAAQFVDWNREIQSIASTARIQTESFDDPEISDDLGKAGFDFADIKREPTTVYLILPPDMMDRHSKWLRLVITSAIRAVLRPREAGEPKVLFMLDEFFALGRLEIISTVWALVRGYGIQMMPVLQGLTQLKKLEPDLWETFIGMAGAVLNFAPTNDFETAEWLSRRAGDTTRMITSGIGSFSEAKTPLITPHRLFGLRPGFMLLALDGVSNIIPAYAPPYFDIQQCLLRARDNPYHRG